MSAATTSSPWRMSPNAVGPGQALDFAESDENRVERRDASRRRREDLNGTMSAFDAGGFVLR